MKWTEFPLVKLMDKFQLDEQQSPSKRKLKQLRESLYLEQHYDEIFWVPRALAKRFSLWVQLSTQTQGNHIGNR